MHCSLADLAPNRSRGAPRTVSNASGSHEQRRLSALPEGVSSALVHTLFRANGPSGAPRRNLATPKRRPQPNNMNRLRDNKSGMSYRRVDDVG